MRHTKSGSPAAVACALMAAAASLLFSGCEKNYYYLSDGDDSLAACISHQKQIVAAAKMYADDWDSTFPWVGTYSNGFWGTWNPNGDYWGNVIRDYVKASGEIYKCPSVKNQAEPTYAWNRHLSGYPEALIQFPTTTPLCWDWVAGGRPSGADARLETAGGIPLDPGWSGLGEWGYYPTNTGASNAEMARACSRHQEGSSMPGGLVVGFVDGHVKFEIATRWTPENTHGRFMPCDDGALPWVPPDYRGIVISMYPADPNR